MKKYYVIYEIEEDTNDLQNKYDSSNLKKIAKWLDVDYSNISKYIVKDIDNINARLKDNKYFIFKEYE